MLRTLIYGRVSTEDQLEKYGLPLQLRACREFAKTHGWEETEAVTDDGVSGTILDRPGLSKVRQMVAAGSVDIVLMVDVDRLSRELAHLLILKPEIEKKSKLEFVNAKFEDSPSGRLFFGIRGVIAQYEREQTRERTMRGKKERALAGLIVGGRTAYGYRYEKGQLTPDEDLAPVVRNIFGWFLQGKSMRGIVTTLRELGAPTWSGRKWGHSSVRRILINETYAGVAHYGTHRREGTLLRRRDPAARIAVPVPPLVSREQWNQAQDRLAAKSMCGPDTHNYLLRGLLRCSCGRRMSGERRRKHFSYRCSGRDRLRFSGEACRQSVNAKKLDAAVWQALLETLTDAATIRAVLAEHERELRETTTPEGIETLMRQVRKLKAREERCMTLMVDSELAEETAMLKSKYQDAQRERKWIEGELAAAEALRDRAQTVEGWLDETVDLLREYLPTLTSDVQRRDFVRGLVTRVDWVDGELKLHCFLGSDLGTSSRCCDNYSKLKVVLNVRVAA